MRSTLNKKIPPNATWTVQGRTAGGTRSGRRNGVWLRRASRGLFHLVKEKVWVFYLYRCWYAACAPVANALNAIWHLVAKQLRHLGWSAKVFYECCVMFDFRVHGAILNAAFR